MTAVRYRLSALARADLTAIGRHTAQRWGLRQRGIYLARLDRRMDRLVDHPNLGVPREAVGSGVRVLCEGRHAIYYAPFGGTVLVMRILHVSMDADRGLFSWPEPEE
ncbi:MAG: type II toxin-antitoxin system RelE/ParE family toxin [Alphaproteobacteria bacterium]